MSHDGGRRMKCHWPFVLLIASALGLMSLQADAHKPSDSYLSLRVEQSRIKGQWDVALRDLEYAIGLPKPAR
jgi:hypothetical protein